MKKGIKFMGAILVCSFFGMQVAFASPSVSTSVSSSTIEKGSSVTFRVTIKNVASWNVRLNGTGSTSSCSTAAADATSSGNNTTKTFQITCKGTDIGLINFSLSGDATSSDGSNVNLSGNKRVNVTAVKPKSTNNYLKSIKVGDYPLTPEFKKETMEYSVKVPSTVNSVTLEASLEDGTARLSGTGEKEVNEGVNSFEIKVNAQNGDERIYKVNVIVEDENPIKVDIKGLEYTVIKNAKNIEKPELYEVSTIRIGESEVPAFVSEITGYTLVALKDSVGVTHFAIYDEKEKSYQLYQEIKTRGLILYIMEPQENYSGFIKTKEKIGDISYTVFKFQDASDFSLVYGMNIETGDKGYYLYDAKEQTFQRYNDEVSHKLQEENQKYKYVIMGFAGGCVFLVFVCMVLALHKPKKKTVKEKKRETEIKQVANETNEVFTDEKTELEKKLKNTKSSKKRKLDDEDLAKVEVEDAMKKMMDAEKLIQDYEKTVSISKKDLKQEKKKQSVEEDTMFDLFEDEKKKKKRKKS